MNSNAVTPRISVIIPTYDRPDQLKRALASVISQTFQDFEIIVVDDCSPGDATRKSAESIASPKIRYVRQPKNQRVAAARNRGIREAKGEFLAFLDDDDTWSPTKLQKQLEIFASSPVPLGMVGCGRVDHLEDGTETLLPSYRGWIFPDLLARRVRGYSAPLLLVRRFPGEPDFYFDESIPALEDLEYCLRIAKKRPADYVPEPLVQVYRNDGAAHVWNPSNALAGYQKVLEKYELEIAAEPSVQSYYHFCIAREHGRLGESTAARKQLRSAMQAANSAKLFWWYLLLYLGRIGTRIGERLLPISPPEPTQRAELIGESTPERMV